MRTFDRFSVTQRILLWALLACIFLAAVPLGAIRPVSWTLLALGILIIFAVQVYVDSTEDMPKQTRGLWLPALLFLAAVAWAWMQVLPAPSQAYAHPVWTAVNNAQGHISADPWQGKQTIMRYLCYAMIFWIACRSATASARAGTMLKVIAVASALIASFGLYALISGNNPVVADGTQDSMVIATFINHNSYATYAAFGLLANIATLLHIVSGAKSDEEYWQGYLSDLLEAFFDGAWIYVLGAALCLLALVLTLSRAGTFAALVGLLVFVASWKRTEHPWNRWLLGIVAAVILFVIVTSLSGPARAILTMEAESQRFLLYPEVVRGILDRPLLGHGLGAFHDAFRIYLPASAAADEWVWAYNSYLENIFELGLPASLAFYLALLIVTLRIYRGTVTREQNRAFSSFALAVIATSATHAFFDISLQVPAVTALFTVIIAMGWAQSFSSRS